MKKIFLFLLVMFSTANLSFAVELPSVMKQSMAQDPLGMPGLLNLVLSMVVVIALIYATGWIYTKLNVINRDKLKKIASKGGDSERFTVLQSMPLGQHRHLYSIEMNGKVMLIGSTPSHINLIREFDKKNDEEAPFSDSRGLVKDEKDDEPASKSSLDIDALYRKYKS